MFCSWPRIRIKTLGKCIKLLLLPASKGIRSVYNHLFSRNFSANGSSIWGGGGVGGGGGEKKKKKERKERVCTLGMVTAAKNGALTLETLSDNRKEAEHFPAFHRVSVYL